jgi:hypothetical protein
MEKRNKERLGRKREKERERGKLLEHFEREKGRRN